MFAISYVLYMCARPGDRAVYILLLSCLGTVVCTCTRLHEVDVVEDEFIRHWITE